MLHIISPHSPCFYGGYGGVPQKYQWVGAGRFKLFQFKPIKAEYQLLHSDEGHLECLDKDSNAVTFNVDKNTEIYLEMKKESDNGNLLLIVILTAPIEVSADNYIDNSIVVSFKEDKN